MPVFDMNYRPWKGRLLPVPRAWYVIAKTHVRLRWKRGVIALLILAAFPFLVRALQILAMTRLQDFDLLSQFAKDLEIDAKFFKDFMLGQSFWFILMIYLTGAGLIANDQKYRANYLYFSKPVTYWDYIAGKFMTVGFFGSVITFVPGLILFLLQVLLAENASFLRSFFWIPFAIIGLGLIALLVFGSLILALSALFSGRSAGIFFFAILLFPDIVRKILSGIPEVGLFSLAANIKQVAAAIFGLELPYEYPVWEAGLVLLGCVLLCLGVLRWRVRPSEVVT
ncbi:ABC transporter permease [bacterium]|nr:ABC transporter permease [bacterium]